jgi:hypothetical protein
MAKETGAIIDKVKVMGSTEQIDDRKGANIR